MAKERLTVVTEAYPEKSKKHGMVAFTAWLTEDGDWIKLFPFISDF